MFLYAEELAIVIWASGEEETVRVSKAIELSKAGEISFQRRRHGVPIYIEPSKSTQTTLSKARHWIKDRGVVGGKYHTPFSPNGHHAQFMLVR